MERTTTTAMDRELDTSGASFRADPDERLDRGPAASSWGRAGRGLAVAGAFALHAVVLLSVIYEYRSTPTAPQAEEIPVEIVVETPEPKPPEPRAKPRAFTADAIARPRAGV